MVNLWRLQPLNQAESGGKCRNLTSLQTLQVWPCLKFAVYSLHNSQEMFVGASPLKEIDLPHLKYCTQALKRHPTLPRSPHPKGKRPGANSLVKKKRGLQLTATLTGSGSERSSFYSINLGEFSLILHLLLDLVELRVKIRPLCISIPFAFCEALPQRKVVLVIWKWETMCWVSKDPAPSQFSNTAVLHTHTL